MSLRGWWRRFLAAWRPLPAPPPRPPFAPTLGPGQGVTVVERIRELGIEPSRELSWRAGDAVRRAWEARTGSLPEKALRRKSSGTGSHCFAIYPESFTPEIDAILRELAGELEAESARQPELFT